MGNTRDIERLIEAKRDEIRILKKKLEAESVKKVLSRGTIEENGVLKVEFSDFDDRKLNRNTTLRKKVVFDQTIFRDGRKITCILVEKGSGIRTEGVARCDLEDEFNESVGCDLAQLRAMIKFYQKLEKNAVEGELI